MENVLLQDLREGMRLDESLHLPGGELVLAEGLALDGVLLESLEGSRAAELRLCRDEGEVEELALGAGCAPLSTSELRDGLTFPWGLYETNGRKILSAGRTLRPHLKAALSASGIEVVMEPAGDAAVRLARRRRILARRAAGADRRARDSPNGQPRSGGGFSLSAPAHPQADRPPPRLPPSRDPAAAEAAFAQAVLASEVEGLTDELSLGFALDVPRALRAARSAAAAVWERPELSVACALSALASGRLRDHGASSAVVALAGARAAGWRRDECQELAACALLHDTAMAWVRETLLREEGPLREEGRLAVRRHPLRALKALSDADGLAPSVALAAMQVHERCDGSGYPLGLDQERIGPRAHLLAAADVLCAVLAPRPHRRELSGRGAMELCVRLAGEGQLHGEAVRALLLAVGLQPVGSRVELSTGETAEVLAPSEASYDRPLVAVVRDAAGTWLEEPRPLDLSSTDGVAIVGEAEVASLDRAGGGGDELPPPESV
jgi:HD-GYP domain-containing protein (c-di-GMP phosphodiesterase class II)